MPGAPSGRWPYWWRSRRRYVLLPLVIGLALCGLGVWSGLVYQHNQAAFRARAVKAMAVIDKLYTSAPSEGVYPPTFDEYAMVHFDVGMTMAHARVLLAANCSGLFGSLGIVFLGAAVVNIVTA